MRRKRFETKPMPLTSAAGPEDGIDPRLLPRHERGPVNNRKALQLCRQVERTLSIVLAGASGDAVLRDLLVQSVIPAPDSRRLLVTLTRTQPDTATIAEVQACLQRAHGLLRQEVAAAIYRRKTPELTFHVL